MKRLVLHIGMPKTGSTALQHFLIGNQELLNEQGVGYYIPEEIICYKAAHNAEFLLFHVIRKEGYATKEVPGRDERIENEMRRFCEYAKGLDTLILSDEDFYGKWAYDPKLYAGCDFWQDVKGTIAERFGEDVETDIVLYLRRQDLWAESHWKMKVCNFDLLDDTLLQTPAEYAAEKLRYGVLDYNGFCERIESCFGSDHLKLCIYERGSSHQGSIERDFIEACGLPWRNDYVIADWVANPSASAQCAWAMRRINEELSETGVDQSRIIAAAGKFLRDHPEEKNLGVLGDEERSALLAACEEGNRMLAKRLLGRDELFSNSENPEGLCLEDRDRDAENAREIVAEAKSLPPEKSVSLAGRLKRLAKKILGRTR